MFYNLLSYRGGGGSSLKNRIMGFSPKFVRNGKGRSENEGQSKQRIKKMKSPHQIMVNRKLPIVKREFVHLESDLSAAHRQIQFPAVRSRCLVSSTRSLTYAGPDPIDFHLQDLAPWIGIGWNPPASVRQQSARKWSRAREQGDELNHARRTIELLFTLHSTIEFSLLCLNFSRQ